MRLNRLTTLALAAALALPSFAAAQTTEALKFEGVKDFGGDQVQGAYTGAYRASRAPFSTPATTFDLFCIDFDNTALPTWTAHYVSFADATTGSAVVQAQRQLGTGWGITELRKAAYLSTLFNTGNYNEWDDIHGAIWSMFSPAITVTAGMTAKLNLATANANASYDSYVLVLDNKVFATDWASNPQTITQGFIVDGSSVGPFAVVPEPSTYALFATGLIAIGFARRRRRTA